MSEQEQNKNNRCFVIMPFTTPEGYEEDHFTKIYEQIIKPAIIKADLKPERVDENLLSTDIVAKIFEGLTECDMAICDLSSRNPNVLYELGIRQAYNKPVLLIKDEKTEKIFDVGGLTTIPYESNRLYENVTDAVDRISKALLEHLKQKNGVVDIIRARLGRNFQPSEIPTSEGMNKDDRMFNLLNSMVSDIDLIKKKINNVYSKENDNVFLSENEYKRKELLAILSKLRDLSYEHVNPMDVKEFEKVIQYVVEKKKISENEYRMINDIWKSLSEK